MKEIISVNNPLIKEITSLHLRKNRSESGLCLFEGEKSLLEALHVGISLKYVFASEKFKCPDVICEDIIYRVSGQVLKKLSTTDSPPDVITVANQPEYEIKSIFGKEKTLIAILENIKDPGNLGTIIRTAAACGSTGIVLTEKSVDVFNPKVIRSSAGNIWKLPIVKITEKKELKNIINGYKNCQFLATVVKNNKSTKYFYDMDYKKPTAIIFGSESEGISNELLSQADIQVTIPMKDQVESLNLGIAVGVVLYESVRQRYFR